VSIGAVYWEESDEVREVVRLCSRCQKSGSLHDINDVFIVSPSGVGHLGGDWAKPECTSCGIDATGDNWWWRM
jgi:hypothetical protein